MLIALTACLGLAGSLIYWRSTVLRSRIYERHLSSLGSTVHNDHDIRTLYEVACGARGLTWSCHICKEERPDKFISVYKHQSMVDGVIFVENVRYCNDRPSCLEGAKTYIHHIPKDT